MSVTIKWMTGFVAFLVLGALAAAVPVVLAACWQPRTPHRLGSLSSSGPTTPSLASSRGTNQEPLCEFLMTSFIAVLGALAAAALLAAEPTTPSLASSRGTKQEPLCEFLEP